LKLPENVFNEKMDYLVNARHEVMQRDSIAEQISSLKASMKKLTKNIVAEEKSIADEIASTTRKRKQEISSTYDDRLDDNRDRQKKVSAKRSKKKSQRMDARYQDETKHIRDNDRDLEVEMKTLLKKNRVPSFVASKLYFIMFMPRGIAEFGGMLLSFLIYFAGIPGIVVLVIKKLVLEARENINMAFWCVLVAALMVIIQLIIYFAILSATKLRHQEVIAQARNIRDKSKANKRQMAAIKNSISKDKDESGYDLDAYDQKLAQLDAEADSIGKEKQEALRVFEDETKQLITDEINGRRLQTLEDMKAEKSALEDKLAECEKQYSDKVLQITNQYASYIGEDLCREDRLADLIALMEDEQAETVSEAIGIYKGQKSSR
jgi:hypothetical protein